MCCPLDADKELNVIGIIFVHNIKTFVYRASAPDGHTVHKTMRATRKKRGQALSGDGKPPPYKCSALCGLLNDNLMAVDFANNRETDRLFTLIGHINGCRSPPLQFEFT